MTKHVTWKPTGIISSVFVVFFAIMNITLTKQMAHFNMAPSDMLEFKFGY